MFQVFPVPPAPVTRHFPAYVEGLPRQEGKTLAVTGCTSGTGRVLARTAARLGARVLMLNRPSERAAAAFAEVSALGEAVDVPCDLQRFDSVREAAGRLAELCPDGLDVLCNNAGVMGLPDRATPEGFDVQMQTNHLSHFLLTSLCWPLFEVAADARGEARIVNHSSGARRGITLDRRYYGRNGGDLGGDRFPGVAKWRRYQQTKLANLLFTYALSEHIASERPDYAGRVKVLCAHPGPCDTGLQAKTAQAGGTSLLDQYLIWRTLKAAQTTEDGTLGILRASCEPGVPDKGFFGPEGKRRGGKAERLPAERDPEAEEICWQASLEATGISDFFH